MVKNLPLVAMFQVLAVQTAAFLIGNLLSTFLIMQVVAVISLIIALGAAVRLLINHKHGWKDALIATGCCTFFVAAEPLTTSMSIFYEIITILSVGLGLGAAFLLRCDSTT